MIFSNMAPQKELDATKSLVASGDISFEENLRIGMAALLIQHPPIEGSSSAAPNQKANFIDIFKIGLNGSLARGQQFPAEQ